MGAFKERLKAVAAALATIEKRFGQGHVTRPGDRRAAEIPPVIPTGSLGLDRAVGVGGIPRGRIVEVFGPESSGKTTLALHAIAECQKAGGVAAFIDAEHALDAAYAARLGVQADDLLVSQPDTGEQALEIADLLIRSAAVELVVVDSVAALVPKAEIAGEMGDGHPGLQARLMNQAMRKLTGQLGRQLASVLFINQIRRKIGAALGNPETTAGGDALMYYAAVRFDIRRVGAVKRADAVIGNRTRVEVVKNKLAPASRTAEFDILYGDGICRAGELIDLGLEAGVLNRSDGWFAYAGKRLGRCREEVRERLTADAELMAGIEKDVLARDQGSRAGPAPPLVSCR